jgi:hypothetical protein
MASLSDEVRDVCTRSAELRGVAAALRARSRAGRREVARRQALCIKSLALLLQHERRTMPSPWSDLAWERPGADLEHVIFPLD